VARLLPLLLLSAVALCCCSCMQPAPPGYRYPVLALLLLGSICEHKCRRAVSNVKYALERPADVQTWSEMEQAGVEIVM